MGIKISKAVEKLVYYLLCICTLGGVCFIRIVMTEAIMRAKEYGEEKG